MCYGRFPDSLIQMHLARITHSLSFMSLDYFTLINRKLLAAVSGLYLGIVSTLSRLTSLY